MHDQQRIRTALTAIGALAMIACATWHDMRPAAAETTARNGARTMQTTPARTRTDAKGIQQVRVPAGSFLMGTSEAEAQALLATNPPAWARRELLSEMPQHRVRITKGYWIDTYEVTNAAFAAFVADKGYSTRRYWSEAGWRWLAGRDLPDTAWRRLAIERPNEPRVNVTWYEAEAYARWRGGSLPTEAQWEYAARGPQSPAYPWGNNFDTARANVVNSTGLTPIGRYPLGVSWVGAHDMAGNAMEWISDWLDVRYYQSAPGTNPTGPATGARKVEKGGWWGSNPFVARSAYRHFEDPPEYADHHIGFRIVSR